MVVFFMENTIAPLFEDKQFVFRIFRQILNSKGVIQSITIGGKYVGISRPNIVWVFDEVLSSGLGSSCLADTEAVLVTRP